MKTLVFGLLAAIVSLYPGHGFAQTPSSELSPEQVLASALKDKSAVFAVVKPLNITGENTDSGILDVTDPELKDSLRYITFELSLALLKPELTITPGITLPPVINVVGVRSGLSQKSQNDSKTIIEKGPLFSDPSQKWLVILSPVTLSDSLSSLHLNNFKKKGFNFYTLYNGGRGAYKLTSGDTGRQNNETLLSEKLIPDLKLLISSGKMLGPISGQTQASLSSRLTTDLGKFAVAALSTAMPLSPAMLASVSSAPPPKPPGTDPCSGGKTACPIVHVLDVDYCTPPVVP